MPLEKAKADRARGRIPACRARAKGSTRSFTRPHANSSFSLAASQGRPSPSAKCFAREPFQLFPERRESLRYSASDWRPHQASHSRTDHGHPCHSRRNSSPIQPLAPSRPCIPRNTLPSQSPLLLLLGLHLPEGTCAQIYRVRSHCRRLPSIYDDPASPVASSPSMMFLPRTWPWITHRGSALTTR